VIRRLDLRDPTRYGDDADYRLVVPRAPMDVEHALAAVRPICEDVRTRGVEALLEYAQRFDGVTQRDVRVPRELLERAAEELEPRVRDALTESISRARAVHEAQRRTDTAVQVVPGGTVTERWVPVSRVGLYVPGGLAVYPSSVIMNVVPAQVAGVSSLAIASPPQRDAPAGFEGWPHPTILGVAHMLGVGEVLAVGGAQAVAMFAYGVRDQQAAGQPWRCRPADLVTGPGNVWVTAAKRYLRGTIGIDSEAGPTEIAILADSSADPRHVAADLISQAEHDPLAASVLVTDSVELAERVDDELRAQVADTKHLERVEAALTGEQSATVLVRDMVQGVAVVDAYAAEHLEIQCTDADAVAARVRNAGAVFVGPWSPVSLGDYCAGSNHVLPTGGFARHSSGLSVQTFLRGIHVVSYDRDALAGVADHVLALADAEDLPAHGAAVAARFDGSAAKPGDKGW
jgi:histidinol dehydrogenase